MKLLEAKQLWVVFQTVSWIHKWRKTTIKLVKKAFPHLLTQIVAKYPKLNNIMVSNNTYFKSLLKCHKLFLRFSDINGLSWFV